MADAELVDVKILFNNMYYDTILLASEIHPGRGSLTIAVFVNLTVIGFCICDVPNHLIQDKFSLILIFYPLSYNLF